MKCLSYTVSVIALVLSALLGAAMADDIQSPTLRGTPLKQYRVKEVILEEVEQFQCEAEQPIYSPNDFNKDGILDDFCIGVKYNPCEYHTLQIAIIRQAMSGGVGCESAQDRLNRGERLALCESGFSPRPPFCND